MNTVGGISLAAALVLAAYGAVVFVLAARGRLGLKGYKAGRRSVYALAAVVTVAIVLLEVAFAATDLSFELVASHSSESTPLFYRLTAMWSSQAGSLLLWLWILTVMASVVMYTNRLKDSPVVAWAGAVLMAIAAFFAVLLVGFASPFERLSPPALDGAGLSPLLRHPSMMLHPPSLYIGYVGFSIPFAFAVGALITRRLDAEWLRAVRRYAMVAWLFLGIGILIGARWSYTELGWGGYWAWDPVENASLMPWLTGTAFLHTSIVQERRGILKGWNMGLVVGTFALALMGTFLVRSGILDSIHAFGESTVGTPFLIVIGVVLVGSIALIASRHAELKARRAIDSPFSREAAFLINNLLLVGLCFVVFWGTFFPLISEALTGSKASVGAPWFNQYVTPLGLLLVGLLGLGPLPAWRGGGSRGVGRSLLVPAAAAAAAAAAALILVPRGLDHPLAIVLFALAALAVASVAQELVTSTHARRSVSRESFPSAFLTLVARNRRRYGGYVVHVGLAVLLVGVAASTAFSSTRDVRLKPGQAVRLDGYTWTYGRPFAEIDSEKLRFGATVVVGRHGNTTAVLSPSRTYFPASAGPPGTIGRFFEGEATSETGLKAGLSRDFWSSVGPDLGSLRKPIAEGDRLFPNADAATLGVVLPALVERYLKHPGMATFRLSVNPMVSWIWTGGTIIVVGGLVALWPAGLRRPGPGRRRRGSDAQPAPLSVTTGGKTSLEAEKETLYAQIEDAEIDFRSGKLPRDRFEEINAELRSEAAAVLKELDA